MAKHTRKGKNPGPVDSWLDTLGYYRKNVAYDETCLFRAISEQMYSCQIYHERCRKEVVEFGRNNCELFDHLMSRDKFVEHLRKLEVHMAICGEIELKIVSQKYKKDVVLFDGIQKRTINITANNFDDTFYLCLMGEDHYDVVYRKETIQTAGFCQSIAYGILYENVFKIPNVPKIVQTMLYEKTSLMMVNSECEEQNLKNNEKAKVNKDLVKFGEGPTERGAFNDYEYMLQTNIAPFPFKVAKALDPMIYRNIEYDTWTETRKELRLGQWYYGDNNLILGTCCLLSTEKGTQQCYIQQILKEEDKCVVYITSLAEKRTVKYSELSPETDAKPWPLPYRFARNVVVPPLRIESPDVNNNNNNKRSLRRRRDKKRSPSKSSTDSANSLTLAINTEVNDTTVKAFEGCPLQMQQNEEYENQNSGGNQQAQYAEVYPVDQGWNKTATPDSEHVIWPQSPTTQHMYAVLQKHVYPVTPEVTYTEPYYYNVPSYQGWATTSPENIQPPPPEYQMPHSAQIDIPMSPDPYAYFYESYPPPHPPVPMQTLPPRSPQVEMYQPMYPTPAPPVTPVIYAGTPDMPEVMIASPPTDMIPGMYTPIYSPAIDMSYMPSPYIYPPTPPATWYRPATINSQGFIFPSSATPQK